MQSDIESKSDCRSKWFNFEIGLELKIDLHWFIIKPQTHFCVSLVRSSTTSLLSSLENELKAAERTKKNYVNTIKSSDSMMLISKLHEKQWWGADEDRPRIDLHWPLLIKKLQGERDREREKEQMTTIKKGERNPNRRRNLRSGINIVFIKTRRSWRHFKLLSALRDKGVLCRWQVRWWKEEEQRESFSWCWPWDDTSFTRLQPLKMPISTAQPLLTVSISKTGCSLQCDRNSQGNPETIRTGYTSSAI